MINIRGNKSTVAACTNFTKSGPSKSCVTAYYTDQAQMIKKSGGFCMNYEQAMEATSTVLRRNK